MPRWVSRQLGLITFGDKGDMTKEEIDFLVNFLIEKKEAGHFRAFWETFGQSVNLMVSGEVVLQSMWSPAVTAVNAEGVPCIYASPKEGMRGWHGGMAISAKAEGAALDQAYEYLNWWLDGWAGAFVARQGYYMSAFEPVKGHLSGAEWDYWYEGKPAAEELPDPFGSPLVEAGDCPRRRLLRRALQEHRSLELDHVRERLSGEALDRIPERVSNLDSDCVANRRGN